MKARTFRLERPVHVGLTLGPLCRGRTDPTMRLTASEVWRASRTLDGPATLHVSVDGDTAEATAWGPGTQWALDAAPDLLGASDDDDGFRPQHPVVAGLHRELAGLRICRSRATSIPTHSRCSSVKHWRWASGTPPSARSSARRITPIGKPRKFLPSPCNHKAPGAQ